MQAKLIPYAEEGRSDGYKRSKIIGCVYLLLLLLLLLITV